MFDTAEEDRHIRRLLDQRARSALALDYDSPSVYSSPFFSPRPNEFEALNSFHPDESPQVPFDDRSRSRLNELAESMLDLDEDDYDSRNPSDDDDAPETVDAEHEPEDSRMSILGPKMRFHGKAPWELDSDALEEEDEPESERGRDGFRKGLGFRSSSRGTTASRRPSGESSRSAKPKRSFETTSSGANSPYGRGGALHALGQASISSASLVPSSGARQAGLRLNFPLSSATRPDSPSYAPQRAPTSPRSIVSPSSASSPVSRSNQEYAQLLPSSSNKPLTRRATNDSATSQSIYSEEMHPYANPDLVVSYADDPATPAPSRSVFPPQGVSRSDSSTTVTDSLTTTLARSATGSTLTPDTSTSSMPPPPQSPRSRASFFHGREISSPLPISAPNPNISSPLMAPNLPPGWTERSVSPTFALISLEQARAQRSRSATVQNHSISSTSSTPFPEVPATAERHGHSPTNSITSRARARSISTGARAKTALQNMVGNTPPKPERRDSEPGSGPNSGAPAKTLKHKKSGFMRLFNGARGAEERSSPPPVPPLSDGYAAFNAQQQQSVAKQNKIPRVPAPRISPSIIQGPTLWGDDSARVSPPRHIPPALSINTGPSRLRAASTADDFQTRTVPTTDLFEREWLGADLPQSAPPNVTEFPALKLRPVSTLFSAHFGDHIVSPESLSGLDADADTLSSVSPSTVVSPITPAGALSRSSGDKAPMTTISEDQSTLVQELQQQITSSKQAWQRHIWDLEGQVRDLKAELDVLRAQGGDDYCTVCGRGRPADSAQADPTATHDHKTGVVNRPRARTGTGTSSRFGSAI